MRTFCFAAALALLLPAPAVAQSGSPVTINSCGVALDRNSQQTIGGIAVASSSQGIRIEFTNESSKTANVVNFAVDSNGRQFVIRDAGTFSPGISIKHEYRNGAGQSFVLPQFIAPDVKCQVASVRFTDGSVWEKGSSLGPAPAALGATGGPLSASPSSVALTVSTDSQLFLVSSKDRVSAFKETDNCQGIAAVFVAATGQSTATYSVKPSAPGSCTATVTDEAGNRIAVPIVVSAGQ